ncbi:MAG TPA: IS1595 family transposase [Candidatus Acidoferrum sp.]|nr:IS1595 family transposase [Candidatus Acidoferrum sp.]
MNLINVVSKFKTEDECIDHLIAIRWPNGVCCIKCGGLKVLEMRIAASTRKNGKHIPARRLFRCMNEGAKCFGYQFTAKAGTIFDKSHLSLHKWFMAIGLIVEAKKGASALQIARHLGMEKSYKTVWYLCHRIREAMQESGFEFLTGTVEVDETYLIPRKPRKGHPKPKQKEEMVVLGMRQRGGPLRLIPVKTSRMEHVEPEIVKHLHPEALLQTDMAMTYGIIGRRQFVNHRMIDHIRTYGEGENHTNTVESAFSLLKKGVYGTFHKISIKHLARYCNEFSYRFNRRGNQAGLFDATIKRLVNGKALRFKTLTASESKSL